MKTITPYALRDEVSIPSPYLPTPLVLHQVEAQSSSSQTRHAPKSLAENVLRARSFAALLGLLLLPSIFFSCSAEDTDPHGEVGHQDEARAHSEEEDSHDGPEGHVELTEQQFHSAEIQVVSAQPGDVTEVLVLQGSITPNADTVLHVTPRVAGRVRSVSKHLGDEVEAGELLCTLDSVQLGDAVSDFIRDQEMVAAAEVTLTRESELLADRLARLTVVLEGAIGVQQSIFDREEQLQQKAVSTVRPLLEAQRDLELAKLERDREVNELEAERDARLLALEIDVRKKRIALAAQANRLRALGLETEQLEDLDGSSPLLAGEYQVRATGSGVIVRRHVSTGEFVEPGAKLYVVQDLKSVWFIASAFEQQLLSLDIGQPVTVELNAFPETSFRGSVSFLDYLVDPVSRSVGVRISLENEPQAGWSAEYPMRPGMFGRAAIETDSREAALVLPESAIVHDDDGDYVFVQVEPFAFDRRGVEVKSVRGGLVEVVSGLEVGEAVAVTGTFLLKSAERQGELGGGHSH